MKSIIFTLTFLWGFISLGVAQQLPTNYNNPSNLTKPSEVVPMNVGSGNNGSNRGLSTFEVSYHDMDRIYSDNNSFTFGYFTWDLNFNATINTNPFDDSGNDFIRWGAVRFDSIYDYNTGTAYNRNTFNSMTLDSIYILFRHENTSGTNDTLVITVYETANTPSGYSFVPGTNGLIINNTVLYTDTIIENTSITPNATPTALYSLPIALSSPVTIPQGKDFIVELRYYGPLEDLFSIADGNRLECGQAAQTAASPSVVPNNTERYYNIVFPPDTVNGIPSPADSSLTGPGGLSFNPPYPANCNRYYFQNLGISAVVTVDAPVTAVATTSAASGCPGQFVTLDANISGGSGDYNITWTGNGNFTAPNSEVTTVGLPTGFQTQTYSVQVIDNVEGDTVNSTVNVIVRGISVNAGADTTIGCLDSVSLTAAALGYLADAKFVWSSGDSTNSIWAKGGTYNVTVSNREGCTATDAVTVNYNVNQTVSFTATTNYSNPSVQDTALVQGNRVCVGNDVNLENTSTDQTNWTFTWELGNGFQQGGVDATVSYASAGNYTVTLTADDNAGCVITSAPLTISAVAAPFSRCVTVGIEEALLLSSVSLYPNPNAGSFIVDLANVKADNANIMVVDMLGKVVYNSGNISLNSNPTQNIEMGSAANGLYFVRITANGVSATTKISVAK